MHDKKSTNKYEKHDEYVHLFIIDKKKHIRNCTNRDLQMDSNFVTVKEADYLDEDPPLRGQNYACLSFIGPEDVIKKKEVFFMEMFIKSFSLDLNEFFDKIKEKYPDHVDAIISIKEKYSFVFDPNTLYDEYKYYVNSNSTSLEKDYLEQNNFQTTIRGLKVRGVFDTLKEAEIRAQVLKKIDSRFHVFVGQVGCWIPFNPNPDEIENQEYGETHLNSLMKSYKENQDKKDLFYEERKRELQALKMKEKLEEKDAWLKQKESVIESKVTDLGSTSAVIEEAPNQDTEDTAESNSAVDN